MNIAEVLRAIPQERDEFNVSEDTLEKVRSSIQRGGSIDEIYSEIDLASITTETILESEPGKNHNPIILITGPSSSGKDLLCREVSKVTGIKDIGSGDAIASIAGLGNDDVRFMKFEDYSNAKMKAADNILTKSPCIINAHLVTKHYLAPDSDQDPRSVDSPGYVVVEPFETKINPLHFIAVVARPEQIYAWRIDRNLTGRRLSDIEDVETISLHERLTVIQTYRLAYSLGSGFSIVYNTPNISATRKNIEFLSGLVDKIKAGKTTYSQNS